MRFNKQELATLAIQPSNKFDKEGILCVTEKQEGFFRKTEVSTERWCRLRGNLLFYFKSNDQFSDPQGLIVLEQCAVVVQNEAIEHDGFVFYLEFEDGLKQRLAAISAIDRKEWIKGIRLASYNEMRNQLQFLREQIEMKRNAIQDVDIHMLRLQTGKEIGDLIQF